jgi:hypothetical protein
MRKLALLVLFWASIACSVKYVTPDNVMVDTKTASESYVVALGRAGGVQYCAAPPPDTAVNTTTQIAAALKAQLGSDKQVDAQTQVNLATTIVELQGRTETVVLLREALYRLCEAGVDGFLTSPQYVARYDKMIDELDTLIAVEQIQASTKTVKAVKSLSPDQVKAFNSLTQ